MLPYANNSEKTGNKKSGSIFPPDKATTIRHRFFAYPQ